MNVIVVSDHGMTWIGGGSGTVYVPVGDYVNSSYVYKVLGKGAMMQIAPYSRRIDTVIACSGELLSKPRGHLI